MSGLIAALERHARERGGALAIRDGERALSWRELQRAVGSLAGRFSELGPGARVLTVLPNGIPLASALLAALASEIELLGAPPRTPAAALEEIAARLAARLVLRAPASCDLAARASAAPLAGGGAILLTTSGTTGHPRVARRSARAVDAISTASAEALGLTAADCTAIAIPLFHSYGLDQLTASLVAGARVELYESFNPAVVRRAIAEGAVTHLPAVPTMLDSLTRVASAVKRGPRLRSVISAGSTLPERVATAFRDRFEIEVGQVYGSSELGTVTATRAGDPFGCVGGALRGVEVRILDRDAPDPERPLATGNEGIVAVSGPGRFDRYVGGDGESEAPGAFVLTGDLGRLDGAGRLWLTGRASLLIDVGAVKVNPLEVETVLLRHPGVREAVVLPLAFSQTGSRLRAVIVPEPGWEPSRDELRRFARERLIDYKVPRVFDIRSDVPRSPTGKILRGELLRSAR